MYPTYCLSCFCYIDCESCTWPISTTPATALAGELWLTRGICFVASRLESQCCCVFGGGAAVFVFNAAGYRFFSFGLRTHVIRPTTVLRVWRGSLASFTSLQFHSTRKRKRVFRIGCLLSSACCWTKKSTTTYIVPGCSELWYAPGRHITAAVDYRYY